MVDTMIAAEVAILNASKGKHNAGARKRLEAKIQALKGVKTRIEKGEV